MGRRRANSPNFFFQSESLKNRTIKTEEMQVLYFINGQLYAKASEYFQKESSRHLRFFIRTTTENSTANIIKIMTDSRFSGITKGLVCGKFVGVGEDFGVAVAIDDGETVVAGEGVEFVSWGVGEGVGVGVGVAISVVAGVAVGCSVSRVNV